MYKTIKSKPKKNKKTKTHKEDGRLTSNLVERILINYGSNIQTVLPLPSILTNGGDFSNVSLQYTSENIYVMGRYNKYNRKTPQTPWEVAGVKLYESSLEEEIIQPFQEFFRPNNYKFHSGGREDIDVRMLGSGRPFVVELISPKKRFDITQEHLLEIQKKVNDPKIYSKIEEKDIKVQIRDLKMTDVDCFKYLTRSAKDKVKAYIAAVRFSRKVSSEEIEAVNSMENILLKQKTPVRVLHRRTLLTRDKIIHDIHLHPLNDNWCLAFVLSSAGTYIKEFVHGDLGRTVPNLGSMLDADCDIFQLDVLDLYDSYNEESKKSFKEMSLAYCFNYD